MKRFTGPLWSRGRRVAFLDFIPQRGFQGSIADSACRELGAELTPSGVAFSGTDRQTGLSIGNKSRRHPY
jgi:hypothetical protein